MSDKSKASGDNIMLMVGTMKGAFLLRSDKVRRKWSIEGPHFRGEAVYAFAHDARSATPRTLAATNNGFWGPAMSYSDDLGKTWCEPDRQSVKFPEDAERALKQIWQIVAGKEGADDVLYCGVEPAALFVSRDNGATWAPNDALLRHEHQPRWQPGGGGLCLHTIVQDPANPKRMLVAISSGGAYRTDDGGKTWTARNVGVRAEFLPDKHPEFGQCVHKVVHHPSKPERLFLQNHWGLYRSDDWGDSWHDIANGVPSDFGFAMQMHPHDPDTVYIVPLESDQFRCTPEAKLRVYRTTNAGTSWEALSNGLPQSDAYETVLRDAMTADSVDPAGIYFGTRSGKVFASNNGGDNWMELADGLPPVVCVKVAVVS